MTEEEIKIVNKTCRDNKVIGQNAIVPRVVEEFFSEPANRLYYPLVLDFGAGKNLIHARRLRELYRDISVFAYDIGDNHTPYHLTRKQIIAASPFSLVYASNVLNVQPSMEALVETIEFIRLLCGGVAIVNYPVKPRKLDVDKDELVAILEQYFVKVTKLDKNIITLEITA